MTLSCMLLVLELNSDLGSLFEWVTSNEVPVYVFSKEASLSCLTAIHLLLNNTVIQPLSSVKYVGLLSMHVLIG